MLQLLRSGLQIVGILDPEDIRTLESSDQAMSTRSASNAGEGMPEDIPDENPNVSPWNVDPEDAFSPHRQYTIHFVEEWASVLHQLFCCGLGESLQHPDVKRKQGYNMEVILPSGIDDQDKSSQEWMAMNSWRHELRTQYYVGCATDHLSEYKPWTDRRYLCIRVSRTDPATPLLPPMQRNPDKYYDTDKWIGSIAMQMHHPAATYLSSTLGGTLGILTTRLCARIRRTRSMSCGTPSPCLDGSTSSTPTLTI